MKVCKILPKFSSLKVNSYWHGPHQIFIPHQGFYFQHRNLPPVQMCVTYMSSLESRGEELSTREVMAQVRKNSFFLGKVFLWALVKYLFQPGVYFQKPDSPSYVRKRCLYLFNTNAMHQLSRTALWIPMSLRLVNITAVTCFLYILMYVTVNIMGLTCML